MHSRDRGIALVYNRLAINQGECAKGRHCLVEAIARKLHDQRLAELLPRLSENEQRYRLGRQQCCMHNQRLGSRVTFRRLLNREPEGAPCSAAYSG
jgi:hypothetical protein